MESLQQEWKNVISKTEPASVRMSLKDGRITNLDEGTVTVAFTSAFHKDKVADTDASRAVEGVMETIFKKQLKLHCTLDTGGADGTADAVDNSVNLAEAASEIF